MKGARWRQEHGMRAALLTASVMAKLMRLPARQFRTSVRSIDKALKQDPDADRRQNPAATSALIREWADAMGFKVERHDRPVI